ncbi:hypothetical protein Glove_306g43 [Diversispora epigaea]|uniref:Uncharacterized protein n=1 Tax=Diversispora epigaea TaxID=1348612 RepID=A0A397HTQ5_9GLOM|nr:hypothetical protein Glove_306g43 [Diversispora epigaea]
MKKFKVKVKGIVKLFQPSSFSGSVAKRRQIGSNITIKEYNKFLERKESLGYKYQRENNDDVFIIDMSDQEHDKVVAILQRYFNIPNNNVVFNPPIDVSGDGFHFSPSGTGELIAPDVSVYPNKNHVKQPHIPYPGPPPGNKNDKPHARIICEVGNSQNWTAKCQLWMKQGQYHRSMTAKLWQQGADPQELHKSSEDDEYVPLVPPSLAITAVNFSIDFLLASCLENHLLQSEPRCPIYSTTKISKRPSRHPKQNCMEILPQMTDQQWQRYTINRRRA